MHRLTLQLGVPAGQHGAQPPTEFLSQLRVPPRFGGLALQRVHLPGHFLQDVVHAIQVLLGAFQLGFGQPALVLVLGDSCRLLNQRAPLVGFGVEDLPDLSLLDNGVGAMPQAGTREQLLDIPQPAGLPSSRYSLSPERNRRRQMTTSGPTFGATFGAEGRNEGSSAGAALEHIAWRARGSCRS